MIMMSEVRTSIFMFDVNSLFYVYLAWMPGQGVRVDYASIIEILIQQLDSDRESLHQVIHRTPLNKSGQTMKSSSRPLSDGWLNF